jgi:hypothetical protein
MFCRKLQSLALMKGVLNTFTGWTWIISIVFIAEIRRGVGLMDSGWRLGRTAHA